MKISYRDEYNYQLVDEYSMPIAISGTIRTEFVRIEDGKLTIAAGYAWDGASGPAFDTPSFMRGSLVHDALYQLIAEGHLHPSFREYADDLLYKICREDGMGVVRAWYVWVAVRRFGSSAATTPRKVLTAP